MTIEDAILRHTAMSSPDPVEREEAAKEYTRRQQGALAEIMAGPHADKFRFVLLEGPPEGGE